MAAVSRMKGQYVNSLTLVDLLMPSAVRRSSFTLNIMKYVEYLFDYAAYKT